jgi:hypothetical protein
MMSVVSVFRMVFGAEVFHGFECWLGFRTDRAGIGREATSIRTVTIYLQGQGLHTGHRREHLRILEWHSALGLKRKL